MDETKQRRFRLAFRIALVVFGLIVGASVAVVGIVRSQWFHEVLAEQLTEELTRLTGARVELAAVEIHPLKFEVDLRGLTLYGSEPASTPPLLAARLVVIRMSPWTCIRGRLTLTRLAARGVRIHLVTLPGGQINLPGATGKGGQAIGKLMNLSIGRVDLADADLYWNDQEVPLDLSARQVALLLFYNRGAGYWGSCSASPLALRIRGFRSSSIAFSTRIHLSRRHLSLSDTVWQTSGLVGTGKAKVYWTPRFETTATLSARGDLATLARALGVIAIRRGDFEGQCHLVYTQRKLTYQGHFGARSLQVHMQTLAINHAAITSDFSGDLKSLQLLNLRISALGGTITGRGQVVPARPHWQFSLLTRAQGVDMDRVLRAANLDSTLVGLLGLESKLSGTAQTFWNGNVRGSHTLFEVRLSRPSKMILGQHALTGYLKGSAQLDPGLVLNLVQAQLQTLHSSFLAQGSLGVEQPGLRISAMTTDFAEVEPLARQFTEARYAIPLQLKSPLRFTGTLGGMIANPRIEGQVQVGRFSLQTWSWSGFSANVDVSPVWMRLKDAVLRSGSSHVRFDMSLGLADWIVKPKARLAISINAAHSPLQGIEDALNARARLTGLISGRLELRGTTSSLAGGGSFAVARGDLYGEPFRVLSCKALVDQSVWSFENILLQKGTGRMTGSVQLNWQRHAYRLELVGSGFSLAQFKKLQVGPLGASQPLQAASLTGAAGFHLVGQGTLATPELSISLNVQNLALRGANTGNLLGDFTLNGVQLRGHAELGSPAGASSRLTLNTSVQGSWPSTVTGHFTNLPLDRWVEALGGKSPWSIPVTASGSFEGSGPLRNPRLFTLTSQVSTLKVSLPGFVLRNDAPVQVRYAAGAVAASPIRLRDLSSQATVEVSARSVSLRSFSLTLQGNVQASIIKLLDPSARAVGMFHLDINASGPWAEPVLKGAIDVRNVSAQFAGIPLMLPDLNGRIALKGSRATIVSLYGASGETSIRLTGYASLAQQVYYHLSARVQNVRFEYPAEFNEMVSGGLVFTGSSGEGLLAGSLEVSQIFVSPDFDLLNWLGQMGTPAPSISAAGASPLGQKTRLDLRITSTPDLRLDSRTLSFVAFVNARIQGSAAHPIPSGDIRLQSGDALVAGNRYRILRGDIELARSLTEPPTLDIETGTRVDRYDLTITVIGPADQPHLAYHSNPPLPTADILSLLALGYTPQQQMMASTGNPAMGSVGASALLSQALSSQVSGRVQSLFGITRISIDPNLLGPSTAGGTRVTIEKQVSHNLTITYSTNTGAAQQQDIRLRWDLSNKISLIGERDINGVYSVEVAFRRALLK